MAGCQRRYSGSGTKLPLAQIDGDGLRSPQPNDRESEAKRGKGEDMIQITAQKEIDDSFKINLLNVSNTSAELRWLRDYLNIGLIQKTY